MPLLESVLLKMRLSQPFRHFLHELLLLLLIVPGRATFRNLSRYSGYVEKTFRACPEITVTNWMILAERRNSNSHERDRVPSGST